MILQQDDQRDHHVTRWRASGLSRAAYCREHGLSYQPFLAWTKQRPEVPERGDAPAFIEVRRSPEVTAEPATSLATLRLPCGVTLRVAVGSDVTWIGRVIATVRAC